jgi:hypothetical protein
MQFVGGTLVGDADYVFTRNAVTTKHSFIELTLNAGLFGGGTLIESIYWRPGCGNDELNVAVNMRVVPEAPTMAAWSLLLLGASFTGFIQKRRTSAAHAA